jgi:alpha-1,2-mannosyltransferase
MTAWLTSAPLGMYRTSPTLNILLYNAIGGSGDELYGVEPASYYVKNLLLNMGVAWPLVLLSPLVYIVSCSLRWSVGANASTVDAVVRGAVLHMQALMWLAVLFSRPHKVAFW